MKIMILRRMLKKLIATTSEWEWEAEGNGRLTNKAPSKRVDERLARTDAPPLLPLSCPIPCL